MNEASVEKLKFLTHAAALKYVDLEAKVPNFAVGIGLTDEPGEYQLAIRLTKESDKEKIQEFFGDLWKNADVDFRVIGPVVAHPSDMDAATPTGGELAIGMSISHFEEEVGAGTLGFFAERRGVRGFVSCNHVVARVDAFHFGDPILSPAKAHGGVAPTDVAGTLEKVATLRHFFRKRADAAFVKASPNRFPSVPGRVPDGILRDERIFIRRHQPVIKVGQASGRREGRVVARDLDRFALEYPSKRFDGSLRVLFDNVYEIESTTREDGSLKNFCKDGDSGSLVYTPNLEPVGLLFTKVDIGGPENTGLGYMNLFSGVLNALDARLLV